MNWKAWFKAAAIRGIKTAAQVGVLLIGSDVFDIVSLDWPYILGCMAGGFVLSILTSTAGLPECDDGVSPLVGGEQDGD